MSGGEIGCLGQGRFQKFWFYWSNLHYSQAWHINHSNCVTFLSMEVLLMIMMISEFSNIWDINFFLPSFYRFQGYKIRGLIRSEKRSAPFSTMKGSCVCLSVRGAYKQIWQFSLPSFLNKRQYSALLRGSVTLRTPGTMMQSWRPNKKKSNERLLTETNSFLNMCPSDEKNLTAC